MGDLIVTIYVCTYVPEHAMVRNVDRNVAGSLPAN